MMNYITKTVLTAFAVLAAFSFSTSGLVAKKRYATPPPLVISPNQSGAMMLQLRGGPRIVPRSAHNRLTGRKQTKSRRTVTRRSYNARSKSRRYQRRSASLRSGVVVNNNHRQSRKPVKKKRQFDPALAPTLVNYESSHQPGTVVINTIERRLYLVMAGGKARRYGVGVGKPGFEWAGTHKVTRKAEWPSWRPPSEMIARERAKGRTIPAYMAGGPDNPLGARAMYLGSTLYRIHGSNQPWSIGKAVSSGCIRMRNQDAIDLYERVNIGTKVVVI